MKIIYVIIICFHGTTAKLSEFDRVELCRTLDCDETVHQPVCGVRKEDGRSAYKLFDNDCLLLKYGCQVDDDDAYGIISMKYCNEKTPQQENNTSAQCPECEFVIEPVCGIRKAGEGFVVRMFENKCNVEKYNCEQNLHFHPTAQFICDFHNSSDISEENNEILKTDSFLLEDNTESVGNEKDDLVSSVTEESGGISEETTEFINVEVNNQTDNRETKRIIVLDGFSSDLLNVNRTVDDFFTATHVFDLPIRDVSPDASSENTRRRLIKVFGPIKVFKPWVNIPQNVSEDYDHEPTLASCYHKCPKKCPDTYAPVCGVPGVRAREPSLMFQNHCFMDVAQCKMYWEDKSETAQSSTYIEATFLFCLGEELNLLYRFLPLIRTLQHMGRLKKKGNYKYTFKNMRFFNERLQNIPKIMG